MGERINETPKEKAEKIKWETYVSENGLRGEIPEQTVEDTGKGRKMSSNCRRTEEKPRERSKVGVNETQ